jgi:hypothetical protein
LLSRACALVFFWVMGRREAFFSDYSLTPLFVAENWTQAILNSKEGDLFNRCVIFSSLCTRERSKPSILQSTKQRVTRLTKG